VDFAVETYQVDVGPKVLLYSETLNINKIVDMSNSTYPGAHITAIAIPLNEGWHNIRLTNLSDKKLRVKYCEITTLK